MLKNAIRHKNSRLRYLLLLISLYVVLVYSITAIIPAPRAVSMAFVPKTAQNVTFLADLSWIEPAGARQLNQEIFDSAMQLIAAAESLIVLDMFLFNDWQGPVSETHRPLSLELTNALIQKKSSLPTLSITVISDPVNVVYGGLPSVHFNAMRDAGINVVLTDLTQLQDSNPLYSGIWRWLIKPFGNSAGALLPNPFGPGNVSVRSYLALLNFKANHRKLMVADNADGVLTGLVSSANPHDGSSAHRNVALSFSGDAVIDLLVSEMALLSMSDADAVWQAWPEPILLKVKTHRLSATNETWDVLEPSGNQGSKPNELSGGATNAESVPASKTAEVQIVSESLIKEAVLHLLSSAKESDQVDLVMFYLSDREIVKALKQAHSRGVKLRVLLDVNKDAFGRTKKGIPNRPVAAELHAHGIAVRWCVTDGEQCHAKMLLRRNQNDFELLLGSGNYTRRNLNDFNLETNAWLRTNRDDITAVKATHYFERQWANEDGREYSTDYAQAANESAWLKWRYRFMEATGISTF